MNAGARPRFIACVGWWRRGDAGPAQLALSEAIALAQRQDARHWELRAATSLARLWGDQGRRDEARELLSPIHDWFTEDTDTPDLKDAMALLKELNGKA